MINHWILGVSHVFPVIFRQIDVLQIHQQESIVPAPYSCSVCKRLDDRCKVGGPVEIPGLK